MQVNYLPDAERHPLWPAISELLRPAVLDGGPVEHPDLVVWIAHENGTVFAAATTLLYEDGEAQLLLAGGCRHREWARDLSGTVSAWAKSAGATKLTCRGRKGWSRYARDCGWVTLGTDGKQTIYQKEL
jgi:hypothetical protein